MSPKRSPGGRNVLVAAKRYRKEERERARKNRERRAQARQEK